MMRRAILVLLVACGSSTKPPPSGPNEVAVGSVDAGAIATTPGDAEAPKKDEPPLTAGWVTIDYQRGTIEHVGRDKALEAMRRHSTRALVKLVAHIEECSSMGGSHTFFSPAYSEERPFTMAHFGGHGAHVVLAGLQLFVASVETHPPSSFGNGRGWCLEKAPRYDGDVLAIVPVRSEAEGMRLLTDLAR